MTKPSLTYEIIIDSLKKYVEKIENKPKYYDVYLGHRRIILKDENRLEDLYFKGLKMTYHMEDKFIKTTLPLDFCDPDSDSEYNYMRPTTNRGLTDHGEHTYGLVGINTERSSFPAKKISEYSSMMFLLPEGDKIKYIENFCEHRSEILEQAKQLVDIPESLFRDIFSSSLEYTVYKAAIESFEK
jgi:hypothetical protein